MKINTKNDWEDRLWKAHEDTVSGMVVCQCGHYSVTRVVWTQGQKRSTDEFTRAPSLLASKLLVYPNKLDYNEAHEDTVSGTVACQCGHFPVTRVVWTQGQKRSTDEFTRGPSLLASTHFMGSGSYNVTICADLGPGYYSAGTITSTVFSAWALHCFHWFDANNGREDSLCKAQEDTVSGRILCKCEHFPNRRIV
ncbi:unnamed protein product [Clavelina lepadiformis]|uniref:Ig-like domain-containing protein n=1 Tax=Clavelina lepadiformis TaxID=159417 RepID=A0ABP0GBQ5_CLALP